MAADALKRSGAKHVFLLAPWMAYGRQDRPAKARESTGGATLGDALHRSFKKIFTLDAHSKLFRKHFHGHLKSIAARDLAIPVARRYGADAVAAPDKGAVKRAKAVAREMRLPFIQCEKTRLRPGLGGVRSRVRHGDPKGHRVVMIDDLVDSGGTLAEAAKALRLAGAKSVGAVVTHAALSSSVPSAKSLGLGYLEIVYRRDRKPSASLVKLLAAHL